jgi:uncharacterized protein
MPSATNPFVYGGIVSGDAFCDREKEIKELLQDIQAGQNVIIYSQRRFGKTSLMKKLLDEAHKKDIVTVYVDLYPISTLGGLIEEYARAIAQSLSRYEKAKRLMQSLFSRLHLTMGLDASGDPKWSVGFDRNKEIETFDEVLACLDTYLKKKGKTGVVVFDEFQQIVETDGEKTERRFRSAIQNHEHVCYIFVGSKRHLLHDIFSNPNRPFYRSGKIFPLGRLSYDDLYAYIQLRFSAAKVRIDHPALEAILVATDCHPYYTQYLCHVLYGTMETRRIMAGDIPRAIELLLQRESSAYMNTWDLLTQRQRQALIALSDTGPGESPYRTEILRLFNISQPAVMIRALKSLMEKDLVDKEGGHYEIIDLFFKRWIRTYISES